MEIAGDRDRRSVCRRLQQERRDQQPRQYDDAIGQLGFHYLGSGQLELNRIDRNSKRGGMMIEIKKAPKVNFVLSSIVLAAAVSAAQAAPVGPLTTFSAGTPAKASEVNGNFTTIVNTVNANDARL